MGLVWFWDFGAALSVTDYDGSSWGPSSTTTVDTKYTSVLQSPSGGGITPGDTHVCRLNSSSQMSTPIFPSSLTQGWLCGRFHWTSGSMSTSAARPMLTGMLSGTEKFEIRGGGAGTASVPIALYVATTLVGTSSTTFSVGDTLNVAIQFDVSGTNHSAGLYIDGVQEVAFTAGSGSPGASTVNQMEIGAPNVDCTWNTLRVYSSRSGDQDVAISSDVWSRTLSPDGFTSSQTASADDWTVFGGAGSQVAGISDGSSATGVESTVASSFDATMEGRNDVLSGWTPATVYGLQGFVFASGDVLTNVTLKINDDGGLINTKNQNPLPAVPDFVTVLALLNSSGGALSGNTIDQAALNYAVA